MEEPCIDSLTLPADESSRDASVLASRLWLSLEETQKAMNILARTNATTCISQPQAALLNGLFQQIIGLLAACDHANSLHLLKDEHFYTYADVLIIIGHYRAAVRDYRTTVLGQSEFSF